MLGVRLTVVVVAVAVVPPGEPVAVLPLPGLEAPAPNLMAAAVVSR
jgi:hypothetical protein